ncbi:YciI family protein [Phycicoccus jejuensis]|uniref:YciI family protein n=1 Tax=Phycicoccus jejuensis TaxID=367299 RepID=UPI0006904CBC|nr:YciI family protein [Phycicoccus jejuensis]
MSRHLVLLPAPEAEWAQLPPEEHEKGMRSHERFHRDLAAGGHRILAVSPLTPSERALSMRPDGSGGVLVTDGPFTESAEQVVGFYLLETDDRADLVRLCTEFATRGEHLEFRDLVEDGEHNHGGAS